MRGAGPALTGLAPGDEGMADAGQLRVPIARPLGLDRVAEAQQLVAGGHVRGKVVVTLR